MSEIVVTEGFEFRDSSRREVARIEIPCWCFPEESRLVVVVGTAVENGREFNWIDCSVRGRRPQPASVDLGPDGLRALLEFLQAITGVFHRDRQRKPRKNFGAAIEVDETDEEDL